MEVGEEVLAMAADLPLELATQATRLLEEHDFTNVLNHIPADAFNDLFTGKMNFLNFFIDFVLNLIFLRSFPLELDVLSVKEVEAIIDRFENQNSFVRYIF